MSFISEIEADEIIKKNMSNKTWQDRLSILLKENGNNLLTVNKFLELKQFISDLRKRDMEALIRIAESKEIIDDGTYYSTEYKNGYNDNLENLQGHIKNYYENN